MYIPWISYTPKSWKISTLKTLVLRAFKLCFNNTLRKEELAHLTKTFQQRNKYPLSIINNTIERIEDGILSDRRVDNPDIQRIVMTLPYKGRKGESLIRTMCRTINSLTNNTSIQLIYKSKKLSTMFQIKDTTPTEHMHNVVYELTCPTDNCKASYIGETARRLSTRVLEHAGVDNNSHMLKHAIDSGHHSVTMKDVNILSSGNNNIVKRKLVEALLIKKYRPSLNVQTMSVPLKLF